MTVGHLSPSMRCRLGLGRLGACWWPAPNVVAHLPWSQQVRTRRVQRRQARPPPQTNHRWSPLLQSPSSAWLLSGIRGEVFLSSYGCGGCAAHPSSDRAPAGKQLPGGAFLFRPSGVSDFGITDRPNSTRPICRGVFYSLTDPLGSLPLRRQQTPHIRRRWLLKFPL